MTLLGATGTIGRSTALELERQGHVVTTPGRSDLVEMDLGGQDAVITCIASRTGVPADAWAVDYNLNSEALVAAKAAGVKRFIMLSALCVQKPKLAFQHAKLAFEEELQASGLTFSIIRPTAFFKSLSGQVERVKVGKPFLAFGNGELTACKPISDRDLARYIVQCLSDPSAANRVLPIGGPGPAITPKHQADLLGEVLGEAVSIRSVPPRMLTIIAATLGTLGFKTKAELARIGHYYATESMLVWDGTRYDADATPEFGTETLADHYRALAQGEIVDDRGAHAVF